MQAPLRARLLVLEPTTPLLALILQNSVASVRDSVSQVNMYTGKRE